MSVKCLLKMHSSNCVKNALIKLCQMFIDISNLSPNQTSLSSKRQKQLISTASHQLLKLFLLDRRLV